MLWSSANRLISNKAMGKHPYIEMVDSKVGCLSRDSISVELIYNKCITPVESLILSRNISEQDFSRME